MSYLFSLTGVGSGFTMKMGATTFHLMTLYTSSKQERESRPQNQRLQHSRLIAQNAHPGNAADAQQVAAAEEHYEVRKAIKDLCRTLDAFIFVIDATQEVESGKLRYVIHLKMFTNLLVKYSFVYLNNSYINIFD
jgi:hypothetical protein